MAVATASGRTAQSMLIVYMLKDTHIIRLFSRVAVFRRAGFDTWICLCYRRRPAIYSNVMLMFRVMYAYAIYTFLFTNLTCHAVAYEKYFHICLLVKSFSLSVFYTGHDFDGKLWF